MLQYVEYGTTAAGSYYRQVISWPSLDRRGQLSFARSCFLDCGPFWESSSWSSAFSSSFCSKTIVARRCNNVCAPPPPPFLVPSFEFIANAFVDDAFLRGDAGASGVGAGSEALTDLVVNSTLAYARGGVTSVFIPIQMLIHHFPSIPRARGFSDAAPQTVTLVSNERGRGGEATLLFLL